MANPYGATDKQMADAFAAFDWIAKMRPIWDARKRERQNNSGSNAVPVEPVTPLHGLDR